MRKLKVKKKDTLVCNKWRRSIKGMREENDDSLGQYVQSVLVLAQLGCPRKRRVLIVWVK